MTALDALYPELTLLKPDVGYAWLEDPRMVIVQVDSASREAIDAWMQFSREIRESWDDSRVLLILVDVSQGRFSPSSYTTSELQKLVKIRPELKSCSAIVLSRSFMSHLIETMVRLAQRSGDPNQNHIFYSREEAVTWLRQMADQFNPRSR